MTNQQLAEELRDIALNCPDAATVVRLVVLVRTIEGKATR